jgi:molybdopterin-guanine dinucleotide biosynthesis protein A
MDDSVSVAVLAGGESSRMGRNKALLPVGGVPIVERVLGCVRDLSDDVMLIANQPEDYSHHGLPIHPDVLPGRGPLGGLYTALVHASGEHTVVVSCDQPFLNADFLRYLLSLRAGYDVVVPLDRTGYPQSMYAVYGKACVGPIRARLDADRLKVIGFFPDVRVREVADAEIDRFDPDRISFFNVNTPEELAEARQLAENHGNLFP